MSLSAFPLDIRVIHKLSHVERIRHMKYLKSENVKVHKSVWAVHCSATCEGWLQLAKVKDFWNGFSPFPTPAEPVVDKPTSADVGMLVSENQEDTWGPHMAKLMLQSFFNNTLSKVIKNPDTTFVLQLCEYILKQFLQIEDLRPCREFFLDPFDDVLRACKVIVVLLNHTMGIYETGPDDCYSMLSIEDCCGALLWTQQQLLCVSSVHVISSSPGKHTMF